jgi:hypothetical protein
MGLTPSSLAFPLLGVRATGLSQIGKLSGAFRNCIANLQALSPTSRRRFLVERTAFSLWRDRHLIWVPLDLAALGKHVDTMEDLAGGCVGAAWHLLSSCALLHAPDC